MSDDEKYMRIAIEEAEKALKTGDIPVGCVIVREGEIIAKAHNVREKYGKATGHAEIEAIEKASERLGRWRLSDCTVYVTLEPCCMCAGAIVNARIKRAVYALKDAKAGCFGSVLDVNSYPFNHKVQTECGVMESESRTLLKRFFEYVRKNGGKG